MLVLLLSIFNTEEEQITRQDRPIAALDVLRFVEGGTSGQISQLSHSISTQLSVL